MAESPEASNVSVPFAAGTVIGFIAGDLGTAVSVIGGLWAAYSAIDSARRTAQIDNRWPLFLVGGCLFIGVGALCAWHRRRC